MKGPLRVTVLLATTLPAVALAGGWPELPVRLVEIEAVSCSTADPASLRSVSDFLSDRSNGYLAGLLHDEPGAILAGRWIRSRPILVTRAIARSEGTWRDEGGRDDAFFLRSSTEVCRAFPPGSRHVLALPAHPRGGISHCDTVPAEDLDCVLEPDKIATQLGASALRLAPSEHLRALQAIPGPVLFDCAAQGTADAPVAVRPLLGTRTRMAPIRRVEVATAPQTGSEVRDQVMIELAIDPEPERGCREPALLCSRGICFEESSRTRSDESQELLFFVRRPDARELVSALEGLAEAAGTR